MSWEPTLVRLCAMEALGRPFEELEALAEPLGKRATCASSLLTVPSQAATRSGPSRSSKKPRPTRADATRSTRLSSCLPSTSKPSGSTEPQPPLRAGNPRCIEGKRAWARLVPPAESTNRCRRMAPPARPRAGRHAKRVRPARVLRGGGPRRPPQAVDREKRGAHGRAPLRGRAERPPC